MRAYLNAYLDHEIVVHTVETFRGRGAAASLAGTLLSIGESTIRLRTGEGDQYVAIEHIVAFRPRDSSKLPKEIASLKGALTKTEVMEVMGQVNAALKARAPEETVRALLGKVIHGAARILAKKEDSELAVAKERCEVILRKCSDPTLPGEDA